MLAEGASATRLRTQRLGGLGHEHLTTVAERHQTRRPVDLGAEVVPVALDRLAGVEPHADGERDGGVGAQLSLRLDGSGGRVGGRGERGAEAVTTRREHVAVVALDRRRARWRRALCTAAAMSAGADSSQSRVESWMSVNRNVTVPDGGFTDTVGL